VTSAFTIGRLAAAAGVHVETVRYYERRGLIPRPARGASGYRLYGSEDLWRLQLIGRGKRLGFTLAEIAEVMGSGTSGEVLAAARAKIAAIDEQRQELARTRCRLEQLVALCEQDDTADCVALRVSAGGRGGVEHVG
jgi:DNA-binding transcriptional MerR regulator